MAVALAECCLAGGLGATVQVDAERSSACGLFGEATGSVVVTVAPAQQQDFEALAAAQGTRARLLGQVGQAGRRCRSPGQTACGSS